MKTRRFGLTIKLPSTLAIKHQLLTMMLEDEIKAVPVGSVFDPEKSPAIVALRRLHLNQRMMSANEQLLSGVR